ncbi:hypothetical protein [Commensalibacter nepenthis]|uniref:Uncharacterized protein n=1 Tax=Commensalibacter nepenthis TaxID=3043872 RepID=A0ABT6Q8N9_9PROT|nr:hypothetical protein [Commensalibacter sp. TBRC 10068]MDI2113267.1 hypothetical protein [Commensalibacter sp. TBRC 10068]
MSKDKKDFGIKEEYEYELPGQPLNPSDEPLGRSFFSNPSDVPADAKYLNTDEYTNLGYLKYWLVACVVMLVLGLTFEFGILGKDGKEGPLCQYLPKNKVCYYMAGVAPKPANPAPSSVK